ncbi:hypothetical protein GCM10009670_10430 [Citricoccus alkalitolerans]
MFPRNLAPVPAPAESSPCGTSAGLSASASPAALEAGPGDSPGVSGRDRFGIENIWAKANDDAHETILRQLGIQHVVHPERDMGRRLAHLVRISMEDYVEVEPGFSIVRTGVPQRYVGRELAEFRLRAERGVSVVAVKDQGEWIYPDRDYILQADDTLLVAGPTRKAEAFAQLG